MLEEGNESIDEAFACLNKIKHNKECAKLEQYVGFQANVGRLVKLCSEFTKVEMKNVA